MLTVYTARYANPTLADSPLVKVGITRYAPKFPLRYALADTLYALAPSSALLGAAKAGNHVLFDAGFARQLAALDPQAIVAALTRLQGPAPGVVLLCYEHLAKPPGRCHRVAVAAWLRTVARLDVHELPEPVPVAAAPTDQQATLF